MAVGSKCLFTATVNLGQPTSTLPTFEDFDPTWVETSDPDGVYSVVSGNIRVAELIRSGPTSDLIIFALLPVTLASLFQSIKLVVEKPEIKVVNTMAIIFIKDVNFIFRYP